MWAPSHVTAARSLCIPSLLANDEETLTGSTPIRRKIKCDRRASICTPCSKADRSCEYPRQQARPGPKPGSRTPLRRADANIQRALPSTNARIPSILNTPPHTAESTGTPARAASFLELTYPSEECETQRDPASGQPQAPAHDSSTLRSACQGLNLTIEMGESLLSLYFSNMTAFSLFSREMLDVKLRSTRRALDIEALLAAMFAFAARFVTHSPDAAVSSCPPAAHFASAASQRLRQALEEHGDRSPPLCIVQAYALLSFYELSRSVRPRSWRILGECIRIAYEMRLHAVDEGFVPSADIEMPGQEVTQWAAREERRRIWWAIWEMDVYASTLRRLPTAIDWSQNATLLPVSDDSWFGKTYQLSCFLAPDPNLRWKNLAESGNRCAKAWFILVNSVMRNTQVLVYAFDSNKQPYAGDRCVDLTLMANVLSCASMSLPDEVVYNGEILRFRDLGDGTIQRQIDADKYALHLMIQLSHFMINHHLIRSQAPWLHETGGDARPPCEPSSTSQAVWTNYLSASEKIVTIVRNSDPHHHRYVNPFLVNTIWFAAAAQCSCRVFGPSSLTRQHRLAGSNLDLLQLTIDRFMSFWGITEVLKAKLARIERGLVGLMRPGHLEQQESERQDSSNMDLVFENSNTASTTNTTSVDMPDADWTSMFGMVTEACDDDFFNSMGGGFPFGLDDLILPGNA